MKQLVGLWYKSFDLNLGNFSMPVSYIQVGIIIFLLFLLILSLAQFRHHFVNWSFKGAVFGILFGFLLAMVLEGFLITSGKTMVTEVLGWKNAPKPIQMVLEAGRGKLIDVLGIKTEDNPSIQMAISALQSLNPNDAKKVKSLICQP